MMADTRNGVARPERAWVHLIDSSVLEKRHDFPAVSVSRPTCTDRRPKRQRTTFEPELRTPSTDLPKIIGTNDKKGFYSPPAELVSQQVSDLELMAAVRAGSLPTQEIAGRWLALFGTLSTNIALRIRRPGQPLGSWVLPVGSIADSVALVWPLETFAAADDTLVAVAPATEGVELSSTMLVLTNLRVVEALWCLQITTSPPSEAMAQA